MNPLEIVARTPKNNCGECGFPTCLAFAAGVCATGVDVGKCPYINIDGLEIEVAGVELEEAGRERDLALVQHLKSKISGVDFSELAPKIGGVFKDSAISFEYLGQQVTFRKEGLLLGHTEPEDPRDQVLLYNYALSGGGRQPDNEWIGMESMPNSISKVRTLATYCELPLARLLTGKPVAEVIAVAAKAGGTVLEGTTASLAVEFKVLPFLPQRILFWEEEQEEGFEAKVKILFDHHALDFLDIESLLFSAERLAERLAVLLEK